MPHIPNKAAIAINNGKYHSLEATVSKQPRTRFKNSWWETASYFQGKIQNRSINSFNLMCPSLNLRTKWWPCQQTRNFFHQEQIQNMPDSPYWHAEFLQSPGVTFFSCPLSVLDIGTNQIETVKVAKMTIDL